MKNKHRILLSIIVLSAFAFLLSGSELLESPVKIFFGFPLGNLTTWFGLIAMATLTRTGFYSPLRSLLSRSVNTAAWIWLPLGYLITGNVNFNFSSAYWLYYSWFTYTALIILISTALIVYSAVIRFRSKRAKKP